MGTHTFSNLMLKAYEILGLYSKDDVRRDIRERKDFQSHQDFFSTGYRKIIDVIDGARVYSESERLDIFYRYEQLYNNIVSAVVISNLDKKDITKRYMSTIIPAIIALDIYTTIYRLRPKSDVPFYFHISLFLSGKYYKFDFSNKKVIFKLVREYIRDYIKKLNFDAFIDLSQIRSLIDNIRPGMNQKSSTIGQKIDICKGSCRGMKVDYDEHFEKLKVCYLSLTALLYLENETSIVSLVRNDYIKLLRKDFNEKSLLSRLYQYIYDADFNKNALEICTLEIINSSRLHPENKVPGYVYDYVEMVRNVVFNNGVGNLSQEIKFRSESVKCFPCENIPQVRFYAELINVVSLLCQGELTTVYEKLKLLSFDSLPYGYLTATYGFIYLALKIKLKENFMRNGTLIPLLNNILVNQGVFTDVFVGLPENLSNPIISNSKNITILRAINKYNKLILKGCSEISSADKEVESILINGLMREVNVALGKLISLLERVGDLSNSEIAVIALREKRLTKRELQENLIGILEHCTLYNCLHSLNVFCLYLDVPGESLYYIRIFTENSNNAIDLRKKTVNVLLEINKLLKYKSID